ncbi:MAG: BolA family transcriptional regulator [Burkholderiales bacterium]|nr:BolA family transcriptional regulator [Burkholderiales bacterium]
MSELTALLIERLAPLAPVAVDVTDDSAKHAGHAGNSGGGHLSAKIVSNAFSGLSAVARHQAVYRLVSDLMPDRLHALSLTLKTPEELARAAAPPSPASAA